MHLNELQRHRCVVVFECTTNVMRSAHTRQKELPHAHRLVHNTDDVYNYRRPLTDNSHPKCHKQNQYTSPHCGGCESVSLETYTYEAIRPKCHHGNCGLILLMCSLQSEFCTQVCHLMNIYCSKEHICTNDSISLFETLNLKIELLTCQRCCR